MLRFMQVYEETVNTIYGGALRLFCAEIFPIPMDAIAVEVAWSRHYYWGS
jgi:hypothetical protein